MVIKHSVLNDLHLTLHPAFCQAVCAVCAAEGPLHCPVQETGSGQSPPHQVQAHNHNFPGVTLLQVPGDLQDQVHHPQQV